jgi:hypothetical protein
MPVFARLRHVGILAGVWGSRVPYAGAKHRCLWLAHVLFMYNFDVLMSNRKQQAKSPSYILSETLRINIRKAIHRIHGHQNTQPFPTRATPP